MSPNPQGQCPWNTAVQSQSVAGRPYSSRESALSSRMEPTTCKRDDSHTMWLMRRSSECSPNSYSRSSPDSVSLKSAYARDGAVSHRSHPFIADGDLDILDTTMSSTQDICDYLIHFSSSSTASEVDHDDFQDFDDTDSDSDIDSDSEAQYITILPDSPWWKAPPSTHSISFSTLYDDDDDLDEDDVPESRYVSDILQQHQVLVGVFHDELRRIIPGDYTCDDDWLKEVDAKLLLAPVESFEDTCRRSMIPMSRQLSTDFGSKPLPDVPVDFDDAEDDNDESMERWEWEIASSSYRSQSSI